MTLLESSPRRRLFRSALVLSLLLASSTSAAQAPPAPAEETQANDPLRRFQEGRRLLETGDFDAALVELRASLEHLPSPNTELLIGHALRLSGRPAEAAMTYRAVISSAGEKVRAGEQRFQATLEEAGRLEATLRTQLVAIDLVVTGAPAGTTVTLGDQPVNLTPDARGLAAQVLREPGGFTAVATAPDGRTARQEIDGQAGAQVSVLLEIAAPPAAEADVLGEPRSSGLDIPPPPLASYVAGGVGVAGLAVFAIFGAMSSSAAGDLEACAPNCPESLRDSADSGSSQQTVANVGLVVGGLGLATAGVLWVMWPRDDESAATPPKAALRVSPAGRADMLVRF